MPVPGLNADKCAQRNRLAARAGVVSAPLRFLPTAPAPPAEGTLHYAHGRLPTAPADVLAAIQALQPAGAPPLTLDDCYVHYAEVANNSFIGDRHGFLDGSTLRNMALDAQAGQAFMNSHRTGDMSHPAELPYGRTFAGRFEQYYPVGDAAPVQRTLVGFFMRAGQYPNGTSGPATDDLHASIEAGSLFDVSVGIPKHPDTWMRCDLCGNDLNDSDCGHAPGTHYNMSKAEIAAQRARGVSDGTATYTIMDGHMNELSGVYDGAIDGAGFGKTLKLGRAHALGPQDLLAARRAYGAFASKGDFDMDEQSIGARIEAAVDRLGDRLARLNRRAPDPPAEMALLEAHVSELQPFDITQHPQFQALAAEKAAAEARATALAADSARREALAREAFVDDLILSHRLKPAQRAGALVDLARAAADDLALTAEGPIQFAAGDGTLAAGSRVDRERARLSGAAPHTLTVEHLSAFALPADPPAAPGAAEDGYAAGKAYAERTNGKH